VSTFLFLGEDERRVEEALREKAQALLCLGDAEGACLSCQSFQRGNHPDLMLVRPEGKTGIEAVRSVQAFFSLPPLRSPKKVVAFPTAENLTPQAQAALLKTLEDPPAYGAILLSARREESLLPTLVSRCLRIRVSGGFLSEGEGFSETARRVASLCVGGKPFPVLSQEAESLVRKISREEMPHFLAALARELSAILGRGRASPQWAEEMLRAEDMVRAQVSRRILLEDLFLRLRRCVAQAMRGEDG